MGDNRKEKRHKSITIIKQILLIISIFLCFYLILILILPETSGSIGKIGGTDGPTSISYKSSPSINQQSLSSRIIVAENISLEELDKAWSTSFDFDGDGKIDPVKYTYSGGANCCYKVNIELSSTSQTYSIPLELEGGYLVFDLSKPDQFDIRDVDNDHLPEIIIGTNGIGRTNIILFDFQDGEFVQKELN